MGEKNLNILSNRVISRQYYEYYKIGSSLTTYF